MAQFCVMCGQMTNCTENCKQCIEEDRRLAEEKSLENSINKSKEKNSMSNISVIKSTDRFAECNNCGARTHTKLERKVEDIYEIRIDIMVNRLCSDCLAELIGKATVALARENNN